MTLKLSGIIAALASPVEEDGSLAPEVLADLVDFLLARGINGICIGGGTSEFVHFDLPDRKLMITAAAKAAVGKVPVLAAVGASSMARALVLARHAADVGCTALLVPAPYFYKYEQRDLETFWRKLCSAVSLPCLLYDLPQYTNPAEIDTVQRLLLTAQNVVGLKDSSGETKYLSRLAIAREQSDFSLLVGDDKLLYGGLSAGWDGAISGVACLCPELLLRLYSEYRQNQRQRARELQSLLDELLEQVFRLPFPWGIRVGLGVRGIPTGPLPLPLAPFRKLQITQFREWLAAWLDSHREIFS